MKSGCQWPLRIKIRKLLGLLCFYCYVRSFDLFGNVFRVEKISFCVSKSFRQYCEKIVDCIVKSWMDSLAIFGVIGGFISVCLWLCKLEISIYHDLFISDCQYFAINLKVGHLIYFNKYFIYFISILSE